MSSLILTRSPIGPDFDYDVLENDVVVGRIFLSPDARRQWNLSRHEKIFLQKRFSHKGYPLYGTEPFLNRFLSEGA